MKKIKYIVITSLLLGFMSGCSKKEETQYLQKSFMGPFDTQFTFNAYAKSSQFDEYYTILQTEITRLDHLYDKYNTHEGVNNIKTINDNAGIQPVVVDDDIINLLKFSIESNQTISFKTNIAMGAVLEIWHNYREDGNREVPSIEELSEANKHTDINKIIIDEENKTVYLEDTTMSLDVGAVAKGYAAELVKQKLIDSGCEAFILSAGGNIVSHGERVFDSAGNEFLNACKTNFCVSIVSPGDEAYEGKEDIAIVVVSDDASVVTSGDYQRYYYAKDGIKYHHLIDPTTLFPGNYMRSLTIITEDSGLADFLSTVIFLQDYETGKGVIESMDGVEAVWLLNDGTIEVSSGLVQGENIYIYE